MSHPRKRAAARLAAASTAGITIVSITMAAVLTLAPDWYGAIHACYMAALLCFTGLTHSLLTLLQPDQRALTAAPAPLPAPAPGDVRRGQWSDGQPIYRAARTLSVHRPLPRPATRRGPSRFSRKGLAG